MNPTCLKVFEKHAAAVSQPGDVSQYSYQFTINIQKFDLLKLFDK